MKSSDRNPSICQCYEAKPAFVCTRGIMWLKVRKVIDCTALGNDASQH